MGCAKDAGWARESFPAAVVALALDAAPLLLGLQKVQMA